MSVFPQILVPVLECARRRPCEVVAKYWHDSPYFIIPPGLPKTRFLWMPRPGYVLVLLFTVLGRAYPLDPATMTIDTSYWYENTEAGFWNEAADMRCHWDPLESSLTDKPYPHFSVATERCPYVIELENPTDDWIYFNVTIHIWEMNENFYMYILRPYLLGIFYFFWKQGVELLKECRGEDIDICLARRFTEELRRAGVRVERVSRPPFVPRVERAR